MGMGDVESFNDLGLGLWIYMTPRIGNGKGNRNQCYREA